MKLVLVYWSVCVSMFFGALNCLRPVAAMHEVVAFKPEQAKLIEDVRKENPEAGKEWADNPDVFDDLTQDDLQDPEKQDELRERAEELGAPHFFDYLVKNPERLDVVQSLTDKQNPDLVRMLQDPTVPIITEVAESPVVVVEVPDRPTEVLSDWEANWRTIDADWRASGADPAHLTGLADTMIEQLKALNDEALTNKDPVKMLNLLRSWLVTARSRSVPRGTTPEYVKNLNNQMNAIIPEIVDKITAHLDDLSRTTRSDDYTGQDQLRKLRETVATSYQNLANQVISDGIRQRITDPNRLFAEAVNPLLSKDPAARVQELISIAEGLDPRTNVADAMRARLAQEVANTDLSLAKDSIDRVAILKNIQDFRTSLDADAFKKLDNLKTPKASIDLFVARRLIEMVAELPTLVKDLNVQWIYQDNPDLGARQNVLKDLRNTLLSETLTISVQSDGVTEYKTILQIMEEHKDQVGSMPDLARNLLNLWKFVEKRSDGQWFLTDKGRQAVEFKHEFDEFYKNATDALNKPPKPLMKDGKPIALANELKLHLILFKDEQVRVLREKFEANKRGLATLQGIADSMEALRKQNNNRSIDSALELEVAMRNKKQNIDTISQAYFDAKSGKASKDIGTLFKWFLDARKSIGIMKAFVGAYRILFDPSRGTDFNTLVAKSPAEMVSWARDVAKEINVTFEAGELVVALAMYDTVPTLIDQFPSKSQAYGAVNAAAQTLKASNQTFKMSENVDLDPEHIKADVDLKQKSDQWLQDNKGQIQAFVSSVVDATQRLQGFTKLTPQDLLLHAQELIAACDNYVRAQQELITAIWLRVEDHQQAQATDSTFITWKASDKGAMVPDPVKARANEQKLIDNIKNNPAKVAFFVTAGFNYTRGALSDFETFKNYINTASQTELPLDQLTRDSLVAGIDLHMRLVRERAQEALGI